MDGRSRIDKLHVLWGNRQAHSRMQRAFDAALDLWTAKSVREVWNDRTSFLSPLLWAIKLLLNRHHLALLPSCCTLGFPEHRRLLERKAARMIRRSGTTRDEHILSKCVATKTGGRSVSRQATTVAECSIARS
jgi:hypothetical protein